MQAFYFLFYVLIIYVSLLFLSLSISACKVFSVTPALVPHRINTDMAYAWQAGSLCYSKVFNIPRRQEHNTDFENPDPAWLLLFA